MKKGKTYLTAFYVETLLMILIFVSVLLVLSRVFAAAGNARLQAQRLNHAVYLAENAEAAVLAAGSPEELAELLSAAEPKTTAVTDNPQTPELYYDAKEPFAGESGRLPYHVHVRINRTAAREDIIPCEIDVYYDTDEVPLYSLQSAMRGKEAGS